MTWKVGPALACGNTVVVKPSEETPQTAALLGEVMNEAGIPPGVYNVVHGFGPQSAGEYLTRHPGVNAITFTGETRTGEAIMAAAAKGVRPVSFELGGKNAGIVFADADFDKAIAGIALYYMDELSYDFSRLMELGLAIRLGAAPTQSAFIDLLYKGLYGKSPSQAETQVVSNLLKGMSQTQLAVMSVQYDKPYLMNAALNVDLESQINLELVGVAQTGLEYVVFGS
jgi:hypothetical protein